MCWECKSEEKFSYHLTSLDQLNFFCRSFRPDRQNNLIYQQIM